MSAPTDKLRAAWDAGAMSVLASQTPGFAGKFPLTFDDWLSRQRKQPPILIGPATDRSAVNVYSVGEAVQRQKERRS